MTKTSLAVQWLRLRASTAGGAGSIPGQGTKIPRASQCGQNKQIFFKNWKKKKRDHCTLKKEKEEEEEEDQ